MKVENLFSNKKTIHGYIVILATIIIFIIVGLMMLKYHVEGEKKLPFYLKQVDVISTAKGKNTVKNKNGTWSEDIYQKNDIYFSIEKDKDDTEENIIKRITFQDFKIEGNENQVAASMFRPSEGGNKYSYEYTDEYVVENSLTYVGSEDTNVEMLEINNQGGMIGLSIIIDNIGKYNYKEGETVYADGRILEKIGIPIADIKIKVSFDAIIETESGKRYKTTITLDLPAEDKLIEGVGEFKIEASELVFKRF